MRALDARPIKKVAEAKYRKQIRAQRRLQKASKRSEAVAGDDEMNERGRMEMASKVIAKAKGKKERPKVKLVVAKNSHKGIQGRPKGVKGRYKVVCVDVDGRWTDEKGSEGSEKSRCEWRWKKKETITLYRITQYSFSE
jgi:AdoMet-dependent rRNA methyltransferase SPB1